MENFEKKLSEITKPRVSDLKHEDILADTITKVKDKSVVSLWWLVIPLYIIAAFVMKSFFMPSASFVSSLHELADKHGYTAVLLFIVLPVIIIVANLVSIKQVYFLSGSPKTINFLRIVITNILLIVISLSVLLIYFL